MVTETALTLSEPNHVWSVFYWYAQRCQSLFPGLLGCSTHFDIDHRQGWCFLTWYFSAKVRTPFLHPPQPQLYLLQTDCWIPLRNFHELLWHCDGRFLVSVKDCQPTPLVVQEPFVNQGKMKLRRLNMWYKKEERDRLFIVGGSIWFSLWTGIYRSLQNGP